MPARPSHIPHATERTALQKMSLTRGLRPEQLHPAGTQIIAGMLKKGMDREAVRRSDLLHYGGRRTAALKAAVFRRNAERGPSG